MGYITAYTLNASVCTIKNGHAKLSKIPEHKMEAIDAEIDRMGVFDPGEIAYSRYTYDKWCEWETDMCILSSRFPGILFHLYGDGEATDDMWNAYFLNGKYQYCPAIITYDKFSADKLMDAECKDAVEEGVYSCQED